MNNITIELPGIEAKLDRIIELLQKVTTHDCQACVKSVSETIARMDSPFGPVETPTAPTEETKPEPVEPVTPAEETPAQPVEEPAVPTVKVADVQQKVVTLSAAGKKDAVREIVMAYASRVSAIPEDKLAEVMDKLNALEV